MGRIQELLAIIRSKPDHLVVRALDELLPRWIPVIDQPPEMNKMVMVGSATHGWVGIGHRVLVGAYLHWEDGDGEDLHEPTHWMPLPEPPEVK